MIPKILHYCWYGSKDLPENIKNYINTWKKYCPDYEIIRWDESNTDFSENLYMEEAFNSKKYAFVSDYMRLKILLENGGIYLDTDVELCKNLDLFLEHSAFTGCQEENVCVTGLIGAEKNHPWIKLLLSHYDNKRFIINGAYDTIPNTLFITELTSKKYGWNKYDEIEILNDNLWIYPIDYFCCKDWRTGKINRTKNTYAIHHFAGSWLSEKEKKRSRNHLRLRKLLLTTIGYKNLERIKIVRNKLFRKQ